MSSGSSVLTSRPSAVAERVALQRHREGVALVVEDRDLALVGLRLPEDLPRDVHRRDVGPELVVAPADPVLPDDVRHRVAAAAVVERIAELGPDVLLEVREIRVVERLEKLLRDEVDDVRPREAHDHVEPDRARSELRDRFVRGVVGRDLDLRPRLLLELLERRGIGVVRVVEDAERACLRLLAVGDGLVVVRDRPGDRVVGARQRQPARADGLRDREPVPVARLAGADRHRRVLAAGEQGDAADTGCADRRPLQQLRARESVAVLWMCHPRTEIQARS